MAWSSISNSNCSSCTEVKIGAILNNDKSPLASRFRALFTLRGLGTPDAVTQICNCFSDSSSLLKHELAYCLGQIQSPQALNKLVSVIEDEDEDPMVRHEAGEAMGAIGDRICQDVLKKFVTDSKPEVAETCQLALARLDWLHEDLDATFKDGNPYKSIDPAPPLQQGTLEEWGSLLLDTAQSLFLRYRALFSLRNHGGKEAVDFIGKGFEDTSSLFKHELAYVLGQMQDPSAIPVLEKKLRERFENPMVRHECAEALGSIASDRCLEVLKEFCEDDEQVVRESCEVALDMLAYERGAEFQYADTVSKVSSVS